MHVILLYLSHLRKRFENITAYWTEQRACALCRFNTGMRSETLNFKVMFIRSINRLNEFSKLTISQLPQS